MHIAFCVNRYAFSGLGATISSLILNCSNSSEIILLFFFYEVPNDYRKSVVDLLNSLSFKGTYKFTDFNPLDCFNNFNSLHGDWTAYGKLMLSDLVDSNTVLYLDCDIIVEVDVLIFKDFDFHGKALAAVSYGFFDTTLGSDFYLNKANIPPKTEYFNSGVLLLNLKLWRSLGIFEHIINLGQFYSFYLPSHDQSLLNLYCVGDFIRLPKFLNCSWPPNNSKPGDDNNMIIHFLGSPKPWDLFGYFLHNGYEFYEKYSSPIWYRYVNPFRLINLKRSWNIRRSYIRTIFLK